MKSKKMLYWAISIPLIVILLILIIVRFDTPNHYISRAMASKAMVLALVDKEDCAASQDEHGSHFKRGEQDDWYAKYIDYMIEKGIFEGGEKAEKEFATDALTYGEAIYAVEKISPGLSKNLGISSKNPKKSIDKAEWWIFYETLLKAIDSKQEVAQKNILLYGTPGNVKDAAAWTAYTDIGIMGFEGISLDAYVDHEIKIWYRGSEIIHMIQDVSEEVTYKNVWLETNKNKKINLYVGTIIREFPMNQALDKNRDGVLADVKLKKGKIQKISLKKDSIEGKVLSVREDSIEIEGYGTFKLDKDFRVYKIYGVVKEQKKEDILVGYNLQKFVVAGKKICAVLQVKSFSAKNIRVLIMNTDFSTIFHDEIHLRADTALKIKGGTSVETIEAGTELIIKKEDERLKDGRLVIEPEDQTKQIEVLNIRRSQGFPRYYGDFEISLEPEGLLLLNDLDIEDYLTEVVPSEMPPSYESEALKAQAVCARTYAYRQIQANDYSKYGAHVDDSTNYQVYNNTKSADRTNMAVKETSGEMVFMNDVPAETYYFSTSCGHTTDGIIWGADEADFPYLKGISLTNGKEKMDLTTNDAFIPFIKGDGVENYDSGFPMYRWSTKFTNKKLAETVDDIGTIQAIMVTNRGTGGIAKTVKIIGSDGEKILKGETQIRNVLGNADLVYKKHDGDTMTGWKTLPSAFIAVDETARDEEKGTRTFTIWGGGYGHGVGMSQNGAQEMAKQGKNYKEILKFFYDGVEVKERTNTE
ncbi:MAG: SpoIID/LytB domain-containing protein [Clostridium sp.]